MAQPPTPTPPPSDDMYLSDIITGAHGDKYQKDLALIILERATRNGYNFRLGYEMAIADKFDDVAFFNENNSEWTLIQTKHADTSKGPPAPLKYDMLFPTDEGSREKGDFSLFKYLKSYVSVQTNIKERKNIILFTNRVENLGDSAKVEELKMDNIFVSEQGRHVRLIVEDEVIMKMLDYVNRDYTLLKNGIVNLFEKGIVDPVMTNFKTPLANMLTVTGASVKISQDESSDAAEMLKSLRTVMNVQAAQVSYAVCKELFKGKSRNKTMPLRAEEETVRQFFQNLVLSVRQPDELDDIIDQDLRLWMRTWIRPDYLTRLEKSQLRMCSASLEGYFDDSQVPEKISNDFYKKFLYRKDGEEIFERMKNMLEKQIRSLSNFSANDAMEYYINRQIEYVEQSDETLIGDNSSSSKMHGDGGRESTVLVKIRDDDFVKQLSVKFANQRFLLLTAEPGMGKSTILNYVSLAVQKDSSDIVYLFNLNAFHVKLAKLEKLEESDEFKKVFSIFEAALSESNYEHLLQTFESNDNKENHFVIFDAFDEILPHNREKILKILKHALNNDKNNNVRILVSARRTVQSLLENEFEVESMSLVPFSVEDQTNFLRKFWKVPVEEKKEVSFLKYVTQLFKGFHSNINRALCEFTGLPLMLKMLADVHDDHFQEYLNSPLENLEELLPQKKFSTINLYDLFVRKCFNNKMEKKVVNLYPDFDEEYDPLFERFKLEHQLLAIELLEISDLNTALEDTKLKQIFIGFKKRIKDGRERSPLVEIVEDNRRFIHQSYAEFLVAKFLFWNLYEYESEIFGIASEANLFVQYPMIRIFFFTMIEVQQNTKRLEILEKHYWNNSCIAQWACEVYGQKTVEYFLRTIYDPNIVNQLLGVAAQHNCYNICTYLFRNHQNLVTVDFKTDGKTPLYIAAEEGHIDVVKLLIQNQANVNMKQTDGLTPLHIAARRGHTEIVKLLCETSAEINSRNNNDWTPLHFAALNAHTEIVKILTNLSGDVDATSNTGATPVFLAAQNGNLEIVEFLISRSANVNVRHISGWTALDQAALSGYSVIVEKILDKSEIDFTAEKYEHWTPLHLAAQNDQFKVAEILINRSSNVNSKNKNDWTPLHVAAENGHLAIVKLLIGHSAVVNAKTNDGWTALIFAAKNGHTEIVEFLVDHSGNVNADIVDGSTSIHFAAQNGHLDVLKILIGNGANVDAINTNNCTPLHLAAQNGHLEIVRMLTAHSADANVKCEGATPLLLAAQNGHLEVVTILVGYCENVNERKTIGTSPLYIAAENGHSKIVETLINNSGKVNIRRIDEWTPLHIAADKGHLEIVKLLINCSECANLKQFEGLTALHLAARNGHLEIVNALIRRFESVNATNQNDWTPLHCAAQNGHSEVVKALINNSANIDARNLDGWSPLHQAALNGNFDVAKILIDNCGTVNAETNQGWTPLHHAAQNGHSEVVKLLIDHLANVDAKNDEKATAIFIAAQNGHHEALKTLIDHFGDVNENVEYLTPLHQAAKNGHFEAVQLLIDHSGNVNAKSNTDETPICLAAQNGHSTVVTILINHLANVYTKNNRGLTPLHQAALNGHAKVLQILSGHSSNVNAKSHTSETPLFLAAQNGHLEAIIILIDCGAIVWAENIDGYTPLHQAAKNGHLKVVQLLIAHFSTVNAVSNTRETPIFLAAQNGHSTVITTLLEHSAKVDAENIHGLTPLHQAALKGHLKVVEILLQHSCNVNAVSNTGATPLLLAAQNGNSNIMKTLISYSANVNAENTDRFTPLHQAALNGHLEAVNLLVKHSEINVNAASKTGKTPLHLAAQEGHSEIVQTLIDNSAIVKVKDNDDRTPFYYAIQYDYRPVIEILKHHHRRANN